MDQRLSNFAVRGLKNRVRSYAVSQLKDWTELYDAYQDSVRAYIERGIDSQDFDLLSNLNAVAHELRMDLYGLPGLNRNMRDTELVGLIIEYCTFHRHYEGCLIPLSHLATHLAQATKGNVTLKEVKDALDIIGKTMDSANYVVTSIDGVDYITSSYNTMSRVAQAIIGHVYNEAEDWPNFLLEDVLTLGFDEGLIKRAICEMEDMGRILVDLHDGTSRYYLNLPI
ncbi:Vacuolar protein sorting 22 [Giardia muris]|uniref:Vacuolar protein sorting 22 n=1 Tax=Giardia muris TaxID=5742 RepID=A0A4Z1T964_GIAMU|nr:Vacuolar protein sorting 22 [Giardia muris]|eukprot:TNJ29069.1 Vacuolar protein sorting 22 [Giardia muris]